jgi:hypothetical protein
MMADRQTLYTHRQNKGGTYLQMGTSPGRPLRITAVDRMTDGVAITFDDGRTGVYSASLLNDNFPKAVDITSAGEVEVGISVPGRPEYF